MTPIINPWYFYLIELSTGFKWLGFFMLTGWIMAWIFTIPDAMCDEPAYHKKVNHFCFIAIVGLILFLFIPMTETQYQMLIASYITPDNLEAAGNSIQELIEYIINCAEQLIG